MRILALLLVAPGLAISTQPSPPPSPERNPMANPATLTTLALRVRNMQPMVQFYSAAFGARFREVETYGLRSQFGQLGSLTLKFVPIRDTVDFVGFPVHQPGFQVSDVQSVIALVTRYGGRQEGPVVERDGTIHAAVRDPDGNTLELYSAAPH